MIIYITKNRINNKVYIGQTTRTLGIRQKEHIWESNSNCDYYLAKAIRKHGSNNFIWKILRYCDNIESLNAFEQYYILYYNSTNKENGYNLQSGGLNYSYSNSTKQKMSNTRKGQKKSKATRLKMSQAKQRMTQETKDKLRQAKLGENNPRYGKKRSSQVEAKRLKSLKKTLLKKSKTSGDSNPRNS